MFTWKILTKCLLHVRFSASLLQFTIRDMVGTMSAIQLLWKCRMLSVLIVMFYGSGLLTLLQEYFLTFEFQISSKATDILDMHFSRGCLLQAKRSVPTVVLYLCIVSQLALKRKEWWEFKVLVIVLCEKLQFVFPLLSFLKVCLEPLAFWYIPLVQSFSPCLGVLFPSFQLYA